MGKLHHFLGVKVIQKPESGEIWIGQSAYTKEVLERFQMEESRSVETPVDVGSKLVKTKEGEDCFDQEQYQSAVGSLLYLSTRTRPDISYAVGTTARFCAYQQERDLISPWEPQQDSVRSQQLIIVLLLNVSCGI